MAEQDAGVQKDEEQPAKRSKPTMAPYLVEEKEEPESSEELEGKPSPGGLSAAPKETAEALGKKPGAIEGEQVDSSEEAAEIGKGEPSDRLRGRRQKEAPSGRSSTGSRGPICLRSAKEAGRAQAKSQFQEAPWRSAGASGSAHGPLA